MFCMHCGTELPDEAKFCWKCGKAPKAEAEGTQPARQENDQRKPVRKRSKPRLRPNMQTHVVEARSQELGGEAEVGPRCPQCRRMDAIQKVSAIVQGGVSTTNVNYESSHGLYKVSTTATGESRTILAQRLAPPPKPEGESTPDMYLAAFGILVLTGLVFWITSSAGIGPACISAFIVFMLLAIPGAIWEQGKAKARLNAKLPTWEQAIKNWNRLYYCARDDIVFDPENNSFASSSQAPTFLYENETKSGHRYSRVGTCIITYEVISQDVPNSNDKFLFWADAFGLNGSYDAGGSEVFQQPPGSDEGPSENNKAAVSALNALINQLTANGWEHIGVGEYWYSHQFQQRLT